MDAGCAKFSGSEGEDAGAGADVENAHTGSRALLDLFKAHTRGGMQAGAKGHTGVEFQHYFVTFGGVVAPCRANDETLADMCDMVVVFPGVGPVFFMHNASLQVTDKLRSQAGKVPQAPGYLLARLFLFAVDGEVGMDFDGLPGQYAVLLSFVDEFDWFFDCYSACGVASQ